ncbi:MAG: hypothetical protein J0I84_23775 [Terrimonas sp.]|nr:hypothetical protein [Terrimonas sp.]
MSGFFKKKLPHCNELFEKFFSPWYDGEDKPKMTRPDMYQIAAYEGEPLNLDEIQYMPEDYIENVKKHINIDMVDAALEDFQHIIKSDKLDLTVLAAVDKYYDRKKIAELIKESDPKDFSNSYVVTVCEFGAMLGYLFKQIDGFDWLYSHPYFHSIIVHKNTGFGITVFDWAIKKFSEYGVDDGFVEKFNAALAGVNGEWEEDEDKND